MRHRSVYRSRPLGTLFGRSGRTVRLHSRHRARPVTHFSLITLACLLLLFAGAGGLLYARLLRGPIDLALLTPHIKAGIDRELGGGIRLDIGSVVLERGGRTGLTVRLRDLLLVDPAGEALAAIPRAEVALDPLALLSGEIAPRRVELLNPRLHVERRADGRIVATADAPPVEPSTGPPVERPVDASAALAMLDPAALAGPARSFAEGVETLLSLAGQESNRLEVISLVDGDLAYRSSGENWRLPKVNARLERGHDGHRVAFGVQAGEGEIRYGIGLSAWREAETELRRVALDIRELPPLRLELEEAPDSGMNKVLVPVRGTVEVAFSPQGGLVEARGRLAVTARQDEPGAEPLLRESDLAFALDPAARRLVVEPSPFLLGRGKGVLAGALVWPEDGEVARQGIAFGIEARELVLASNDVNAPPLPVQHASVSGALMPANGTIRLDSMLARTGEVEVSATGVVALGHKTPGLQLELAATAMPADVLKQLWPGFVAHGARRWIVENVDGGRTGAGQFRANYPPEALYRAKHEGIRLADDALQLALDLHDVTFHTVEGLPAIKGAKGIARLEGNSFRVEGSNGEIGVASADRLAMRSGSFEVPMIHGEGVLGRARMGIAGKAASLAELLRGKADAPDAVQALGRVAGDARLDVLFEGRLKSDMTEDDYTYRVGVELDDFSVAQLVDKKPFEKASVRAEIGPRRFDINARGLLDGVPASLELRAEEPPTATAMGNFKVSLLLDEKSGPRFGLDFGGLLTGPALARAEGKGSLDTLDRVSLDITNARLAPEGIGTLKAPGRKGEIAFRPVAGPGGGRILRDLEITSEDLAIRGSVTLAASGEMQSAEFSQFKVGRGEGASLSMKKQGAGTVIAIRGRSVDIGPVLKASEAGKGGAGGGADGGSSRGTLALSVEVERLLGLGGEEIRNASFRVAVRDQTLTSFEGSGRFASSNGTLKGSVGPDSGNGRQLAVDASDAGALLRFLDLYQRMQGGQLALRARLPSRPDQTTPGILSMRDFRVVDDPAIQKLAQQTSAVEGRPTVIPGNAMPFDQMRVVFERVPGKTAVREGWVRGPAAGATLQGMIDHKAGELNLSGTFVPAYGINNLFSRLPIVGQILGGRADEGLLGLTFAMRGKIANPTFAVNPLSAIAPGLFRRIFEFNNDAQPGTYEAAAPNAGQ